MLGGVLDWLADFGSEGEGGSPCEDLLIVNASILLLPALTHLG